MCSARRDRYCDLLKCFVVETVSYSIAADCYCSYSCPANGDIGLKIWEICAYILKVKLLRVCGRGPDVYVML